MRYGCRRYLSEDERLFLTGREKDLIESHDRYDDWRKARNKE
jgi:hypothetical protein